MRRRACPIQAFLAHMNLATRAQCKKKIPQLGDFLKYHLPLVRHFRFGKYDVLAQFWIIFAEFHFASRSFRLGIFSSCVKEASFFVFQLYNFFTAFFRCHFGYLLIILRLILG